MESKLPFSMFNFHPTIVKAVVGAGYQQPTPIQLDAIPPISAGRDLLGLAQTGTGKTAAFALPILNSLLVGSRVVASRGQPRALVIVPTRELCEQVNQAFRSFARGTGLKATAIYGGVKYGRQINELRQGSDVVVACPGRLLDHLERGSIDLSGIQVLVLDEADQMFDMGFLPNIRRIIKVLPSRRQTLLFSATMPSELRYLVKEVLRNPVNVEIDGGCAAQTVKHRLYDVAPEHKMRFLQRLTGALDSRSILVFTRTKRRAQKLAQDLNEGGQSVVALQGNLSQGARTKAMQGFRSGKYRIMVATDIAARGIDISTVSHVVNFDMPQTVDAYVHRIGRTGRALRCGDAVTLVTAADGHMVKAIERRLGVGIERGEPAGFIPRNTQSRADRIF